MKKLKILKTDKPPNEIVNQEDINIISERKIYSNKIEENEKIYIPNIQKEKYENEIKKQDIIFIPCVQKEKDPLLIINNDTFYIEGNKALSLAQKRENIIQNKINEINIEGIKKLQNAIPQNEIKSQEKIFIPSQKKDEPLLVEDKVLDNLSIKGMEEDEISYQYKIYLLSQEKRLLEERAENIIIPGKINEKKGKELLIQNIFFNIPAQKKDLSQNLENEFINELVLKGKNKIFTDPDIDEEKKDKFFIQGNTNNQLKNKNLLITKPIEDNFFIKGIPKPISPEEEEEIMQKHLLKKYKGKKPYEICPQVDNFNIEDNIEPEIIQELYLLRNKNKKKPTQEIKPISENKFTIKGSPSTGLQKSNNILLYNLPDNQSNIQFSIFGKQKKPYIIENKGCFNIISCTEKSKPISNIANINNNLIVQGSCFGLFGNKNEPGQMTQDIENLYLLNLINNWKEKNRVQKFNFPINGNGNNNKTNWNDVNHLQKSIRFGYDKTYKPLNLKNIKEYEMSIINKKKEKNKKDDDEIINNDYNYTSLEKDEIQRRPVKATITKVEKQKVGDDDLDELDPFSNCKKHTGKKYDKIFNERKSSSSRIKNDSEMIPGDVDEKKKNIISNDGGVKKGGSIIYQGENERKTGPILFKKIKDKNINLSMTKSKEFQKNKSMGIFKHKEKKTEYLRDYDNDQNYYS